METLIVIPARGGSKGIPRKNLRPVAGKPMIFYSIRAALASCHNPKVVVTTDDDEIALMAERFGADVIMRPHDLADDKTTLDPVIKHAFETAELDSGLQFDKIVTVQPTSPLVTTEDIDNVITKIEGPTDTVLTAVDDRHLCWTVKNNAYTPAYKARVNRQSLPVNFKETGAVIGCSRKQILRDSRIGENVDLHIVPNDRSFDIDNYSDLYLCEAILNRKRIVFTVVGYPEVGLGHAYRAIMLANELVVNELIFVCEEKSQLATSYIESMNFKVIKCKDGTLAETVNQLSPDLIINDVLDTSDLYMSKLKEQNTKIINFEDLSEASLSADLVINALYPHEGSPEKVLSGHEYFCLRDEFLYLPIRTTNKDVKNVLITFGGVDEGNLTKRTLELLSPICRENGITIYVITGPGYIHDSTLSSYSEDDEYIKVIKNTKRISDYMAIADVAVTSGGRTVLELAGVGVPPIVICQNERETKHTFAREENGVINLGYRLNVQDKEIIDAFMSLVVDSKARENNIQKLNAMDLTNGKKRVIKRINELLEVG